MGVDSVGTTSHDIIKSQTVAEYFVKKVIFEVADVIKTKVDISKLNEQCRKLAMLGMEAKESPQNICYDCKKEVKDDKNLKCKFCKKKIHDQCAEKLFDKDDMALALLQRASFSCSECLAEVTPIMIEEDEVSMKVLQLSNSIDQLAIMNYQETPELVNAEDAIDLELEETCDDPPIHKINNGAGTSDGAVVHSLS